MIKKIMSQYSCDKIIRSSSILVSVCMIGIGVSVILHNQVYNEIFYLIYFILIMILTGIAISFIDITIFYILQQSIPEKLRGRVLSIGITIAKIMLPVALIIAGSLINIIPTYILPMIGGAGLCIFSMKKPMIVAET